MGGSSDFQPGGARASFACLQASKSTSQWGTRKGSLWIMNLLGLPGCMVGGATAQRSVAQRALWLPRHRSCLGCACAPPGAALHLTFGREPVARPRHCRRGSRC